MLSKPEFAGARSELKNFENKMLWMAFFEKDDSDKAIVNIKRPVPSCSALVPPEIKAWVLHLRNSVLRALDAGSRANGAFV